MLARGAGKPVTPVMTNRSRLATGSHYRLGSPSDWRGVQIVGAGRKSIIFLYEDQTVRLTNCYNSITMLIEYVRVSFADILINSKIQAQIKKIILERILCRYCATSYVVYYPAFRDTFNCTHYRIGY